MDERYEIRGKIGQGGIGAVYRAYDQRMNREVAIKRIIPEGGDADHQDEATRQLTKEAGALAALQHPHIVTVYDVGADEDGPYVVMEMLTGKTLDELVERAPLTVNDFREVAIQTQEAMIAAQDLHIVHRDIKPGNIMLTWLPSGKFQVKIVDFGLAKFTPKPSKQTLDQADSVYGSIFFMAPEQFERGLVDGRTDLYAMGCVYYFALTGKYPFDGETGPQVMASHLSHLVKLIGEVRPDLPQWLRDWVMWHINRNADDRPTDARESLQVFLRNDGANVTIPAPPPSAPRAPAPPMRPSARVTAAVPTGATTQSAPQSLQPPEGSRPSVHTTSHVLTAAPAAQTTGPVSTMQATRPQPVPIARPPKKKLSTGAKMAISGIMAVLAIIVGMTAMKKAEVARKEKALQALINKAEDASVKEITVTPSELKVLIDSLKVPQPLNKYAPAMRAIRLAATTDVNELDKKIAEFATTAAIEPDVRQMIFRDIVSRRKGTAGVKILIDYARDTKDGSSAEAALGAISGLVTDSDFPALLDLVKTAQTPKARAAAADTAKQVIKQSGNRARLIIDIEAHRGKVPDDVWELLLGIKLSVPQEG